MPSEAPRIAAPWARDLRNGACRRLRSRSDEVVAEVWSSRGKWCWSVGKQQGFRPEREEAKAAADQELRKSGFAIVDVVGGCAIEKE